MFRLWQRLKFFAGFIILGTLFVVLWYGMLLYSERYVKAAPETYREEETVTVPPELEPGYREREESREALDTGKASEKPTEKSGNEKPDMPRTGEVLPVDEISVDEETVEVLPVPNDKEVDAGSGGRGEGAVIFGKSASGDGEKKAQKAADDKAPDMEPAAEPAPEPGNLAAMMQWLKVEKGDPVFLRIVKADRLMELWMKPRERDSYVVVKKYPIQAMSGKLGPKKKKGDMQAPEGFYRTFASALNPNSNYHLSFNVGYPNAWDRMNKRTGSLIMVHGNNVSAGCFAMGDENVEEIYGLVEAFVKSKSGAEGVPIQIYPFVPTSRRIVAMQKSENYPFWRFLKDAWDWTELHKAPAPVRIGTNSMILEGNMLSLEGVTERQVYRQAKLPGRWGP